MSRALYTAATGMTAQQLKIDVIANNLANVNTDGFKRSAPEFQDLMYQTLKTPGAASSESTTSPSGLQVGLGTRAVATGRSFANGELKATENPLDVAIEGAGLFRLRLPGGEYAYTRAGSFKLDGERRIVSGEGHPLEPEIRVPQEAKDVSIASDGVVSAVLPDNQVAVLGRLQLFGFANVGGLEPVGGGLYRATAASGAAIEGLPGEQGLGSLQQGFLEASNVRVVEEMIAMIMGQRAYEASSKVIQTADRMLEDTNRLR